ncbi:MAG TPA: ATP-binding protein, partial [Planctomycetia bacterium]|nr:ATP-binding protein [Planctomycetia bacterium]
LLLGFGAAFAFRRSILQLQVRLQDAAGKLGDGKPELEWSYRGPFAEIDAQFSRLDKHIEEVVGKLQQREREFLRADQLAKLGRVAAGVAHEIRNPLTAVKLLVQASLATNRPPGNDDLIVIESEIRRMESSLGTLLDYSRAPRPAKTEVAPQALVESVVDLVRNQASRQGVSLDCTGEAAATRVFADGDQLKQVFLNLALNALDAMPKGGALAFAVVAENGAVRIDVSDTGPGIDAAFFPQLFEPFASTKETGVGLGLALSKRIVEEHGGTLDAENPAEGGARFTVRLPRGFPDLEPAHA